MKRLFLLFIFVELTTWMNDALGNEYTCPIDRSRNVLSGIFQKDSSSARLFLNPDGTFVAMKPERSIYYDYYERCDYYSKGKWSLLEDNVIELTSENYFSKEPGYDYELIKEKKHSQDSLYFHIVFPSYFHPVKISIAFDNKKNIMTEDTLIVVSKADYLVENEPMNHINIELHALPGYNDKGARTVFEYVDEDFDIDRNNCFTLVLPHFDICFFQMILYNQELILIKKNNVLRWKNSNWRRILKLQ